ncbi:MAG: VWA domain-containing protein [Halothiobacillus sp.]
MLAEDARACALSRQQDRHSTDPDEFGIRCVSAVHFIVKVIELMQVRPDDDQLAERSKESVDGTVLLSQVQRRLQFFLTALWGGLFKIEAGGGPLNGGAELRPCIQGESIQLPRSFAAIGRIPALATYRAAATHAAAHLIYSTSFNPDALKPRQRLLVELIEDARIEYLAFTSFPGLRRLWLSQHSSTPPDQSLFPSLVWRLSRALLLLEQSEDSDFWVSKGVRLFLEHRHQMDDMSISREIGLRLAHDLGQMRLAMDEGSAPPMASYRDDNHHLWREEQGEVDSESSTDDVARGSKPAAHLEEGASNRRLDFSEERLAGSMDAQGYYVEIDPAAPRLTYLQCQPTATDSSYFFYPEWFERIGLERAEWCTVCERAAERGGAPLVEEVLTAHRFLLANLRRVFGALRTRHLTRLRKQEFGDEMDLNAALTTLVDIRAGLVPDMRVNMSMRPHDDPALALSLLLDLSESVNNPYIANGKPVLTIAREAVILLAQAATELGNPVALAGFRSNGRHNVEYLRIKGFEDRFDVATKDRLAGLSGKYSTRIGAAIRHAVSSLATRSESHRLLIVITDGEPADIDVFDDTHLTHDARQAVISARRLGTQVFCISLDPQAETYIARIFGEGNFIVLANFAHFSEKLSRLLLRLVFQSPN